ncbi:WhiB family transcriptional regulator [Rhodococcus wratislaviensis]|uniref:WhiB family transcriptional regulator n=1 Tax=Rhodococcus wratislaviensis TaxID=44752 RepID=UPI000F5737BF|nr:WhiB family transcriptional regulator [Rhodococcus wratislaviensis]
MFAETVPQEAEAVPQEKDTEIWQWRLSARCRTEDAAIFFPPDGERPPARAARESAAKRMCSECAVSVQCLNFALATGQHHGVWGTTTPEERHHRHRSRRTQDPIDHCPRPKLSSPHRVDVA